MKSMLINMFSNISGPQKIKWVVGLLLIAVIACGIYLVFTHKQPPKPLYWVSQMDPNYRSNAPGKCPHGMDLIPVYAEKTPQQNKEPGVVAIAPQIQQQMGVRKTPVHYGSLSQTLLAQGRVIADPNLMVTISPRFTGWVESVFIGGPGELVKRKQPLFSVYSPQLIQAQEKFLHLFHAKNAAETTLKAESELQALGMDDIALQQLKNEGVAQQHVVFHAPKDGVVDMLKISKGSYFQPGSQLVVIGSMENIWIELQLPESQAGLIKTRLAVSLTTLSRPGLIWQGEIDHILPDINRKSHNLSFRVKMDNRQMLLMPNMQIQGVITLPERPPSLLAPLQAVIQLGHHNRVVMVTEEGNFKSVEVKLGQSNSDRVEILEGLKEGDMLVSSAQFLIDAESSKTSDFMRMETLDASAPKYPPTWVNAEIKEIILPERKLNLKHEAVTAWKMPSMTMNFQAAENLELGNLQVGDHIKIKITDGDPLFRILEIQPMENTPSETSP
jgi:membrane fusion protein, copper/silver efflux system